MRIEKGGKPAVEIAGIPFREEVVTHSNLHGMPYLPFVCVDYAQEVLPLVPPAVSKVFDKMVKALTTPAEELMKHIPGEVL